MRCIIARFPFDLTKTDVLTLMHGVKPEPITGASVIVGRRHYPAKQVGELITRQDRRDFTADEVTRALSRLGFTCTPATERVVPTASSPLKAASALFGLPA
jgi:hypothetical protein